MSPGTQVPTQEAAARRDLQPAVPPWERRWRKGEGSGSPRHAGFISGFDPGQEWGGGRQNSGNASKPWKMLGISGLRSKGQECTKFPSAKLSTSLAIQQSLVSTGTQRICMSCNHSHLLLTFISISCTPQRGGGGERGASPRQLHFPGALASWLPGRW